MTQTRKETTDKKTETGSSENPGLANKATLFLSGLFGRKAVRVAEKQVTLAKTAEQLKKIDDPVDDDFDAVPSDDSLATDKSVPASESFPEEIVRTLPPFQVASEIGGSGQPPAIRITSPLFSVAPPKEEEVPATPYQKFKANLDIFSRQIATAAQPSAKSIYPFRIISAALKVDEVIRKNLGSEQAYLKISPVERVDYDKLLFYLETAIRDYPAACKEKDPQHTYNETLRDLESLAKRMQGGRSAAKIIGGLVLILIGAIGAALAFASTFISGGILGLPSTGLCCASATLAASGAAAVGGALVWHGRRKELSEAVGELGNTIAIERKI